MQKSEGESFGEQWSPPFSNQNAHCAFDNPLAPYFLSSLDAMLYVLHINSSRLVAGYVIAGNVTVVVVVVLVASAAEGRE